ncbi:ABC transporter substrate-binding protein [Paraburkholderia flagellata]|uniref:ABC transporter substrate-binding protein n=1 Tax=Paraburkholderia flagellata TaxID=2883241 RepID=UPI001F3108C8|nr:ABC transporter substrate-binding protein [Paraburkholderia flagellata]
MSAIENTERRRLLRMTVAAGGVVAAGALLSVRAFAGSRVTVNMQLGWIPGGNQIAEVTAKRLGYYEQEGIDFHIQPGGPNIDGVAIVASGRFEAGEISSSPSIMLAVSQGLPIKCIAVGLQQHPYTFFSLKRKPIRTPHDMIGKRIGIQATGMVLLKALLAKNSIPESQVDIVPIGADMMPLLSGQVDAVTGWQTNTSALKPLGTERVDLRLWDAGVHLYALPYYTTSVTLREHPDTVTRFLRATARGWIYANAHRDEAVRLLVEEYPNLNYVDERVSVDSLMGYAFNQTTQAHGWGAMDAKVWEEQISMYGQLGQFVAQQPKVEDVMTLDVLDATRPSRLLV